MLHEVICDRILQKVVVLVRKWIHHTPGSINDSHHLMSSIFFLISRPSASDRIYMRISCRLWTPSEKRRVQWMHFCKSIWFEKRNNILFWQFIVTMYLSHRLYPLYILKASITPFTLFLKNMSLYLSISNPQTCLILLSIPAPSQAKA